MHARTDDGAAAAGGARAGAGAAGHECLPGLQAVELDLCA